MLSKKTNWDRQNWTNGNWNCKKIRKFRKTDIPSEKVGEIVMETLARIDTVAYVRFASVYKNFQAADDFEDFVSQLRPDIK